MNATKAARGFAAIALLAIALHPLAYFGMFAGDAEIHLVYARNASMGHWFEFNPGEKSPGVTSSGYMVVLAGLFRVLPEAAVPAVVKGMDLAFWYGSLALVLLLIRALTGSWTWAWIGALIAGLLPGSAYNASIGMENGIFGFQVLLLAYLAERWRWFEPGAAVSAARELAMGTMMGLACWMRPEGFVVAALLYGIRLAAVLTSPGPRGSAIRSLAGSVAPCAILAAALFAFQYGETGYALPGSGLARIVTGHQGAWRWGPLTVSPRPALRMAVYFPLTAFWLVACGAVLRRNFLGTRRFALYFALALSITFLVLYSTVLGSAHLARYLIFVMPFFVAPAVAAAKWIWDDWLRLASTRVRPFRTWIFALAALPLAVVFGYEIRARSSLDGHEELTHLMAAPAERSSYSDKVFAWLGSPSRTPLVLAYQEVQLRYWLDDRFIVRSLDGRTDPLLLSYVVNGAFDHIGYLRDRKVDFLMEAPNYNARPEDWSLARLDALRPGESSSIAGLLFTRLPAEPSIGKQIFAIRPAPGARSSTGSSREPG